MNGNFVLALKGLIPLDTVWKSCSSTKKSGPTMKEQGRNIKTIGLVG